MSAYSFVRVERYSDEYSVAAVKITAQMGCGRQFDIGAILEPDSPNPCLLLHKPLGLNGVREILEQWENLWQEDLRPETVVEFFVNLEGFPPEYRWFAYAMNEAEGQPVTLGDVQHYSQRPFDEVKRVAIKLIQEGYII